MRTSLTRRVLGTAAATAAAALVLAGCSSSGDTASGGDNGEKTYKIGVNQLVQHPALDATVAGFQKAFDEAGINVEWDVQNANGEQSTAQTIAQSFATADIDMAFAVATPSAQATAQSVTDQPVVFASVTDAVAAGIVKSNEEPGGNVTGVVDAIPVERQFDLIKEIVPDAKKIGIVYSSAEVNSEVQVKDAQDKAGEYGYEIVTQTVSTGADVQQATEALGDVDAIYVPTDNTVVSSMAGLSKVAEEKKIPVFGTEEGTVEIGGVAANGIDFEKLGQQAGELAIKILKDGADPATTPVETPRDDSFIITLNPTMAEKQGATIPEKLLEGANIVGE